MESGRTCDCVIRISDIHGLAGGTKVTLFDCFLGTAGLAVDLSGEATIVVNLTLVGEHIPSLDAKHFDAMEISPEGLAAHSSPPPLLVRAAADVAPAWALQGHSDETSEEAGRN
jgi:hypothetical protein